MGSSICHKRKKKKEYQKDKDEEAAIFPFQFINVTTLQREVYIPPSTGSEM